MTKKKGRRGGYYANGKNRSADRYGTWQAGKQTSPEMIAGRSCWWPVTG